MLKLLKEVQQALADALDSLGSKTPASPEAAYLGSITGQMVNRAADGFLVLREAMRTDASKLLVRPVIEALFNGAAVMAKRGILFRKAYSELEEDKKMFGKTAAVKAKVDRQVNKVAKKLLGNDPKYPIKRAKLTVADTATAAGMSPMYDGAYRAYCQFTHGAVRAVEGHLDDSTDTHDTWIVVASVLMTLEMLAKHTPAKVPNLEPFLKRLPKSK